MHLVTDLSLPWPLAEQDTLQKDLLLQKRISIGTDMIEWSYQQHEDQSSYKEPTPSSQSPNTGSVYHYDIHEDTHDHHGGAPAVKMVMEDHNPETLSYIVDYQGDPRYSYLKFHQRFLRGPSLNTTYLKWLIDYSPYDEATGAPDDLIALNLPREGFKDLVAHLEEANK